MEKPRLIFIAGPTAVGKSGLAHRLAKELGGEIINADSLQVYRRMDIGTAKPSLREREEVPYHLIDILDPDQPYDAADFRVRAGAIIDQLRERRVPIFVVGGTGLYLRVLQRGLFDCPKPDPALRLALRQQAMARGPEWLWSRLARKDSRAASRIHPRDLFRIIRALEVLELTGQPISHWQQWDRGREVAFDLLWIGLNRERAVLYERINRRTEEMIQRGLLEEVRDLIEQGYHSGLKSMSSLGYRHMVQVLEGRWEREQAIEFMKRDTRRYAKRQLTWLAREPNIIWFSPEEFGKVRERVITFWGGSEAHVDSQSVDAG
jgi:tRNA dimethylallyltransferase